MVVRDETINSLKGYVASYLKSRNIKLLEIPWKENKEYEEFPMFARRYNTNTHAFIVITKLGFKWQRKFPVVYTLIFCLGSVLITVLFMVCEDKPWPRLLRKHLIGSVPIV